MQGRQLLVPKYFIKLLNNLKVHLQQPRLFIKDFHFPTLPNPKKCQRFEMMNLSTQVLFFLWQPIHVHKANNLAEMLSFIV